MTLGERIRMLRESRGLTKKSLATAVGVAPSAVVAWEKGEYEPSKVSQEALAEAFDIDRKTLLFGPAEAANG
jgi:repressor LexA